MLKADVIIIGGGQAGLAMSRCLAARDIDHVVLERGRIGERWRSTLGIAAAADAPRRRRLPGLPYRARPRRLHDESEVIATSTPTPDRLRLPFDPSIASTAVDAGRRRPTGVVQPRHLAAADVVIATGHCDLPRVPDFSRRAVPRRGPAGHRRGYRHAAQVPPGGVLVVGASASGVQLADELAAAGRWCRWPSALTPACRVATAASTSWPGSTPWGC